MRTVFSEQQSEDLITRDGYFIFDLLNSEELENVCQIIKKLGYGTVNESKFRISVIHDSVEMRNEIFKRLSPVFQRSINKYIQNYKVIRIGIFDKLPGGGNIKVHQHANLVDESICRSLATWIPLCDTTVEMGTLHVVKGSHKFSDHVRSYDDYYYAFNNISAKIMKKNSVPVLLKAGQAVIFNDRLIHWSPPNKSSRIRTAIQLELIPQETKLSIYYRANDQELLKYEIDEMTYRVAALAAGKPDDLRLIGKLNQPIVSYDNKQFMSMVQETNSGNTRQERNFFQRLFNL